eukprot:COSAG04_NODE_2147_length_4696_cov_27.649772_4_plen_182_part_00
MCSLTVWLNGERRGVMVKKGLKGPLRWAVDLQLASVRIDGPKPELAEWQRELDGATRGSEHDDQDLPRGTVVYVGRRRGTYQSFNKKTFGANEHTIRFDDGSTETLKLKEVSDWRFVRELTPAPEPEQSFDAAGRDGAGGPRACRPGTGRPFILPKSEFVPDSSAEICEAMCVPWGSFAQA